MAQWNPEDTHRMVTSKGYQPEYIKIIVWYKLQTIQTYSIMIKTRLGLLKKAIRLISCNPVIAVKFTAWWRTPGWVQTPVLWRKRRHPVELITSLCARRTCVCGNHVR